MSCKVSKDSSLISIFNPIFKSQNKVILYKYQEVYPILLDLDKICFKLHKIQR